MENLKTLFWLAAAVLVMVVACVVGMTAFGIALAVLAIGCLVAGLVRLIVEPWLGSKSWPA